MSKSKDLEAILFSITKEKVLRDTKSIQIELDRNSIEGSKTALMKMADLAKDLDNNSDLVNKILTK